MSIHPDPPTARHSARLLAPPEAVQLRGWPYQVNLKIAGAAEEEGVWDIVGVDDGVFVGGGGGVGQAGTPLVNPSDPMVIRVQLRGLEQLPWVPAGKVIYEYPGTPETLTEERHPAAPSTQTVPDESDVPYEVMLSGPTAATRAPAQGCPPKVTDASTHVRRGLRSASRVRAKI